MGVGEVSEASESVAGDGEVIDSRLPVTVIAGFLGAGKTTWLNQRIAEGQVDDALIIVNDVGAVNVDVESIAYRDDRVLALTNGCMCCTLGGSLVEQLSQALRLKSRPSQVIIEASGVADPARIADVARLAPGMRLAEVVVLVDAGQARRLATDMQVGQLWRAQLVAAQRILVNRLPAGEARDTLLQWLKEQAPGISLECMSQVLDRTELQGELKAEPTENVATEHARCPERSCRELSCQKLSRKESSRKESSRPTAFFPSAGLKSHRGAAHGMSHKTVRFGAALLLDELESVLREYLDVLLRAKGFVHCRSEDGERWVSLQLSGRQLVCRGHAPSANGSLLVCIGRGGLRFDQLIQRLQALDKHAGVSGSAVYGGQIEGL